jgi:hypothetical protein
MSGIQVSNDILIWLAEYYIRVLLASRLTVILHGTYTAHTSVSILI